MATNNPYYNRYSKTVSSGSNSDGDSSPILRTMENIRDVTEDEKVKLGEYVFKRLPEFFKAGTKETVASIGSLFGTAPVKDPKDPLGLIKSNADTQKAIELVKENPNIDLSEVMKKIGEEDTKKMEAAKETTKKLRQKATEQKEKASEGLSGVQKFGGAVAEFLPGVIATAPIASVATAPQGSSLAARVLPRVAEEIVESQLVFNPEEYDKDNILQARAWSAVQDIASYGVIKGAGKVAKPVLKKMGKAVLTVGDNVIKKATRVFINDAADEVLDKATYELGKQDFLDILQGRKVMDDNARNFFSSPEWVNIARKYGTDYEAYPDILRVTIDEPIEETIQTKGVSGLLNKPANDIGQDVKRMVSEIGRDIASGNVNPAAGKSKMLKVLFNSLDDAENYSLKIDRKEIANIVTEYANHIRAVDDFNYAVAEKEFKQATVGMLNDEGLYDPILMLRRISNLTRNKASDSLDQIASYNKWAKKSNNYAADELADALRRIGFNIEDPAELVDFAQDMPTKTGLKGKIEAPEPYDLNTKLNNAIKIDSPANRIEQPKKVVVEVPNKTSSDGLVEGLTENQKKAVDSGEALIDQNEITKESLNKPALINEIRNKAARNFPYSFESTKIASYGEAGRKLVTKGRRAAHTAILTKSEFLKMNNEMGLNILTDDEWLNVRNVMEGKAAPQTDRVASMASKLREVFDNWASKLDMEDKKAINYFPRFLNEDGKDAFSNITESSDIVRKLADKEGITPAAALEKLRHAIKKSNRKGSFEFPRVLDEVPSEFRKTPLEEMLSWENEVARRYGVISEFGADVHQGKDLINQMALTGKSLGEQIHIAEQGEQYLDKIIGKSGGYTDIAPIYNFLKQSMVVSKLSPLTTAANELQGFISSYLDEGWRGVIDANNKANDELIDSLGLDNIKGKIGDELKAESFADEWMRWIGMEESEIRGFKRSARATFKAIERSFDVLKENPTDEAALKYIKEHGMFVEKGSLEKALGSGEIPDFEMKMGIMEGVRRKMFFQVAGERPHWATTDAGSVAYIFHNYLLSQMRLLSDAPLGRQLVYIGLIAPITGAPVYTLRQAMYAGLESVGGDKSFEENLRERMPSTPGEWFNRASTSGSVTPLDVLEITKNKSRILDYAIGGFSPLANVVTSSKKGKAAVEGFAPGGTILSKLLFPGNESKTGSDSSKNKESRYKR